jgi:uncharacterized membrane protein YvbJ
MDSGLEHITLPRESQMGIPHITPVDLEHHLHNMKTNGQYRPTVNDIVEAQQQNEELSSKTSLLWSIIVWSIVSVIIIILCIVMCYFIYSYQYFHTTFLSALKLNTRQHLRAFLVKFFFNHTNNPNPEILA